ncbi:MAG TPA: hypothetical protein VFY03_12425 [Woeseiaceae bacterium]|nr:hypothetical protein [Woeseiaceae bacterium]
MKSKLRKVLPGLAAGLLVAGCGSNVRLDPPTIPAPLVNSMPLHVVVRIPDQLQHFTHTESVIGNDEWTIDLGRSNAVFFEQLFGYMFDKVTVVGPEDDASLVEFDALIEPSIDAFEFSVPAQTKSEAFAVWIRYRIQLYDPQGQLVGNYPVSAYGKSLTTLMGGDEALQRAAVLAMRDAAALMIIRFDPDEFLRVLSRGAQANGVGTDESAAAATATANDGGSDE